MKTNQNTISQPVMKVVSVNEEVVVENGHESYLKLILNSSEERMLLAPPALPQFDEYKFKAKNFDPL